MFAFFLYTISRLINFVFPDQSKLPALLYHKINIWNKLAELTADRYGFIATPKVEKCISNFFKLSSGLSPDRINFDYQAYLAENERIIKYFEENRGQNLASHPINPIRIKAIMAFSDSIMYQQIRTGVELMEDVMLTGKIDQLTNILMTLTSSELDYHRINFMAAAGLLIAGVDSQVTREEAERIMSLISRVMIFPKELVEEIHGSGKVLEVFNSSAGAIINANPGEKYGLFDFMVGIALADRQIFQQEIDFLYNVAESFGLSRKEAAQMIAQSIQREFMPELYA